MWLNEIEADRLRNLKTVSLSLPSGLSLLSGANGQGKTSLLEAIYLLATGRSFRTRRADELLAWEGGPLRVAGVVTSRIGRLGLKVIMDGEARSLLVDGVEQPLGSFLGRLDVVDLTAERMRVLRGAPDERRRFLDRGLVCLQPPFLRVIGATLRGNQQADRQIGEPVAQFAECHMRISGDTYNVEQLFHLGRPVGRLMQRRQQEH